MAFIEGLPKIETSQEVGVSFMRLFAPYGFIAVACGGGYYTPTGLTYQFFFNTWPAEWLAHYQANDYVRHDVAPLLGRLTARPFSWRDVLAGREFTEKQGEFHGWLSNIGIVDGLVVPIHYPGGDFGLTVIVSDHFIDSIEVRLALHMAAAHAHQHCRNIGSGVTEASSVKSPLTARELECLRWVLQGKSDTDIGTILDISHTTVHFHIERVKRKLGVKTRTQAASLVVTLGYL
jgi:DNA-binding CsgD family transcriptional regulator